jgi:hypothetical protein
MRVLVGMTAALALLTAPALAADAAGPRTAAKTEPLKPGKSAGVHAAQQARAGLALVSAGAIIAIVVVAASASSGNGSGNAQPNSQSVTTTP